MCSSDLEMAEYFKSLEPSEFHQTQNKLDESLVPAFHQAVFGSSEYGRVVLNIGGIANISVLQPHADASGFDIGPGNMLADAYMQHRFGQTCDRDGALARSSRVIPELLQTLLAHPYNYENKRNQFFYRRICRTYKSEIGRAHV